MNLQRIVMKTAYACIGRRRLLLKSRNRSSQPFNEIYRQFDLGQKWLQNGDIGRFPFNQNFRKF